MTTISIGSQSYTKTSLQSKCREIVATHKNKFLKGHAYEVALWIYQQRVSTVLPSPLFFKIEDKGVYSGFIWSTDKREWFNMSFKKALLTDIQEVKHNVSKAFRHAVYDQIKSFRTKALAVNPTLARMAKENPCNVHTDHVVPFHLLLGDFLQSKGMTITDIVIEKHPRFIGEYVLQDQSLSSDWQAFHLTHARFNLVSASQNYAKANQFDLPLYQYQLAQGKTYDTKRISTNPLTM